MMMTKPPPPPRDYIAGDEDCEARRWWRLVGFGGDVKGEHPSEVQTKRVI